MATKLPVVAIIGSGFGGMNAARALKNAPVEVVLFDQHNYHLFQPLLYQVATAGLAPTEIAYPVRAIFRHQKNLKFRLAKITGIDFQSRQVKTATGSTYYDYLIIAAGGQNNFFGNQPVERNAIGLKDMDDAIAIRNRIIEMFEQAALETDPQVSRALRTFVIVGGGPTGVESAGALSELARMVLSKDYPEEDPQEIRILLLEMSGRLLSSFPEDLARNADLTLRKKHVDIRYDATVTNFDGKQITLKGGEAIPAHTLIWAAGVRGVDLLGRLGLKQARQGRVVVERTLQVPGHPEVFVVGDAAYLEKDGQGLPMVAPVAIQQGKLAARNIGHLAAGKPLEDFEYHDPGSLATIGRNAAVAQVKGIKFHGLLAWVVWLAVHIFWLIGFRNRLLVLINWASDYFFYERAVRLITPHESAQTPEEVLPVS